jgi:hypothetical protein
MMAVDGMEGSVAGDGDGSRLSARPGGATRMAYAHMTGLYGGDPRQMLLAVTVDPPRPRAIRLMRSNR